MGANKCKAKSLATLERRQQVARLYMRGLSQYDIARELQTTRVTVAHDLMVIRKEWLASAVQAMTERKATELAKIDQLEATAWEAWERSRTDATTRTKTEDTGELTKKTKEKTTKGKAGDARFLEIVMRCIDKRCRLFNLIEAKEETAGNTENVGIKIVLMQPEEAPAADVIDVESRVLEDKSGAG